MRCPKCGYNSFDHNLLCPKCRKDLTATRRLLNLTVPVPGPINFFQPVGLAAAFEEPLAEAAIFGDQLPLGQVFSTEPVIEDIMPLADYDETIDYVQPIDLDATPGNIAPVESDVETMPFDINPVVGEEEIEIDTMDDALVEHVDIAPKPTLGQTAALDQIRSTLAETGDLAAAPIDVEFQDMDLTEESPAENYIPHDLEIDDLEESVIGDIDDSDILDTDLTEENFDESLDAVSVDLDSEDLASDIFDESPVETESVPSTSPEGPPPLQADAKPEGPAGETEVNQPSVEFSDESVDESGIDLEMDLDDLEEETMAEEVSAENLQESKVDLDSKKMPADDKKRSTFPSAIPKIPARVFGSVVPEASQDTSKTDTGSLESADLSSLVDEINLDDLDSEL